MNAFAQLIRTSVMVGSSVLLGGISSLQSAAPPGWTSQTIGTPSIPGTVSYNASTGTCSISGPDHVIDGQSDKFQFTYQALVGDGEIVARLVSMSNAAAYTQAGLMLRASLDPTSANIELYVQRDLGVGYRRRVTPNSSTAGETRDGALGAPIWLKLVRLGQRVATYTSSDGISWKQLDAGMTVALAQTVYVGFSVRSSAAGGGGVAVYDSFSVRPAAASPTDAQTTVLGRAAAVGAAYRGATAGSYTLVGNGSRISTTTPDFLFLHVPMAQDGEIRARITGVSVLGGNTNMGLMIRDSFEPGAVYASIALSPNGLRQEHIDAVGSNPTAATRAASGLPIWLRIVRKGVLFTASSSLDGISWTPLGGTFALPMGSNTVAGLTLVAGGYDTSLAQVNFDQVAWPVPAAPNTELDAAIAAGLASWRKPDANGIRCVDCHTPFGYDIAQFNFTRADVRLATTPHLPQADADAIFNMLARLRTLYPPVGGLKDFRTHRPMQPGGAVVGGEAASPDVRDATFGFYVRDHFKIGQDRISTLPQARAAAQELIDVNPINIPVGIKFNLWSRSVLREGAVAGGEIAEWLPSAGIIPKPEYADYWFKLQDNYLRDPSNENFWSIYHAAAYWTDLDSHNFIPGVTHPNWRYIAFSQYLANSLFAHDELLKARGLPSQLAAQDGVRPFPSQRNISKVELAPFWNVGDNARVVSGNLETLTTRNRESVHYDLSYNNNRGEVIGWQIGDFKLTWFWLGWAMDNSLRFSGEGSTLSGEYFIGALWMGDVDNARTGDSDSSHGYRMHQVFFNALNQFKLGYKPGAWRDEEGTPQHFEASKGYYLGYYRWHTRDAFANQDIGLPGANALYKRMLSNHIRMALLVHADEARKLNGTYYNEGFTQSDLSLWGDVLHWADPEWRQADDALLADLKRSLAPPPTLQEMGDPDNDGQPTVLENSLGTPSSVNNAASNGSYVERSPTGDLQIVFRRQRSDYTYVVEASANLLDWNVVVTNPGQVGTLVTVPMPVQNGEAARYMRLRIIETRL